MRRLTVLLALGIVLGACSEGPLDTAEANWCRAYLTPNQIALSASEMGIDVDPAMTEANIAYDMEALIGGDLIAQIDAYWEVMEEDDGYRSVCRTLYAENR